MGHLVHPALCSPGTEALRPQVFAAHVGPGTRALLAYLAQICALSLDTSQPCGARRVKQGPPWGSCEVCESVRVPSSTWPTGCSVTAPLTVSPTPAVSVSPVSILSLGQPRLSN